MRLVTFAKEYVEQSGKLERAERKVSEEDQRHQEKTVKKAEAQRQKERKAEKAKAESSDKQRTT